MPSSRRFGRWEGSYLSLWGKLGGAVLAGVGAVTGNPGLIAAGASVFAGDVGSEASKKAARTQSEAADKAIAETNRLTGEARTETRGLYDAARNTQANLYNTASQTQNQIYNSTAANYSPYQQVGASGLSAASQMMGGAPVAAPAPFSPVAAPTLTAGATTPGQGAGTKTLMNDPSAPAQPLTTDAPPPAPNPRADGEAPQVQAAIQSASSYAPGSLGSMAQPGMVLVRSPDGRETRPVPEEIARALVARGAQVVS